jgi:hypothetical protein
MGSINLTVPLHAPMSLGKNASNAIKTVEIASWQAHVLLANGGKKTVQGLVMQIAKINVNRTLENAMNVSLPNGI